MAKPTKRLNKRTQRPVRGEGTSAVGGRNGSGAAQAKVRRSIADNKYLRAVAILFLPVLLGVFGLIMYPPSFDLSANNVTNSAKINKSAAKESIIHGHGNKRRNDRSTTTPGKDKEKQRPSQTTKNKAKTSEMEDFQPTILDSLAIQDILVDGNIVSPVELTKDHPSSPVK